jgi:hypothetical protein
MDYGPESAAAVAGVEVVRALPTGENLVLFCVDNLNIVADGIEDETAFVPEPCDPHNRPWYFRNFSETTAGSILAIFTVSGSLDRRGVQVCKFIWFPILTKAQ